MFLFMVSIFNNVYHNNSANDNFVDNNDVSTKAFTDVNADDSIAVTKVIQ